MAAGERVGRWALGSLIFALALLVAGRYLASPGMLPFWGGLLAAFGEAALVGGLADWFAVRALFAHPFGIPFPHTALIPRNRQRIIRQIRDLVVREWLPLPTLRAKVEGFDLVDRALVPLVELLRPRLRDLARRVGREVLASADPRELAELLARGLAGAASGPRVGPFVLDLLERARQEGWLRPIVVELVTRLRTWIDSPSSKQFIRARLDQAAHAYSGRDLVKFFTFSVAELVGGLDLDEATAVIQAEMKRFASEQLATDSQMHSLLDEALIRLQTRLKDNPEAIARMGMQFTETGRLTDLLEPVVTSLRSEAGRQLEAEGSFWVELAVHQAESWLARLCEDEELKARANRWLRRLAIEQLEANHHLLGALAEEQMGRLNDEKLSELIYHRVGEDLNWIRLNGTFVGGLIGVVIYLTVSLLGALGR